MFYSRGTYHRHKTRNSILDRRNGRCIVCPLLFEQGVNKPDCYFIEYKLEDIVKFHLELSNS